MSYEVKTEGEYKFIEEGQGEPLLLLHGLFGALSNWEAVVKRFKGKYRVIIPMLPIYEMPIKKAGLPLLNTFVEDFVSFKKLKNINLLGNSLGGHVALIYTLKNSSLVKRLILTGSSGLFENSMGASYPKRGNYDFVTERVRHTFFNPEIATKELIDQVYSITKSIPQCLRMVAIAKSAQRHNMATEIQAIKKPTLLIWGLNDTITPPVVGHEFNRLIPNSELKFVDHCCHAPMMEQPDRFNEIFNDFMERHGG